MKPNSFQRYIFYAVGEILLVVIGILIALQVNNWNEERKTKAQERKILYEIRNDINETLSEVKNDLNGHQAFLRFAMQFKDSLMRNSPNLDSMAVHFFYMNWDLQVYPKSTGFETLKSKGLDLISNDSLRIEISDLYQLTFTRLVEHGRLNPENDIRKISYPYKIKHLKASDASFRFTEVKGMEAPIKRNVLEIKSLDNLRKDEEFFVVLDQIIGLRLYKINLHLRSISEGEDVLAQIDEELSH